MANKMKVGFVILAFIGCTMQRKFRHFGAPSSTCIYWRPMSGLQLTCFFLVGLLSLWHSPYQFSLYLFVKQKKNKIPSYNNEVNKQETKLPICLNGHLSIKDSTLTSCQEGSYLNINSPIIEGIKLIKWQRKGTLL